MLLCHFHNVIQEFWGFSCFENTQFSQFQCVYFIHPPSQVEVSECITFLSLSPVFCCASQCTAPLSQPPPQPPPQQMPHPTPQQAPHPGPQQMPHPGPQPVLQPHRQETGGSTETLGQPGEATPPHAANALRSSSPKPDASELYLKSKAFLDSKRECNAAAALRRSSWFTPLLSAAPNTKDLDVYIRRNQESGFGFRVLGGEGPDQPVGSSCAGGMEGKME